MSKPAIKYLRVMIDAKPSFREPLEDACQKVTSASAALANLLPNIGEQKHCRRLLLARLMRSILLCTSSVPWTKALANYQRQKLMNSHCFGLDNSPEDSEYVMFHCSRFAMKRKNVKQTRRI